MRMRPILWVALAATFTGCAFGTNHVRLPEMPPAALPEQGTTIRVSVKDARGDLNAAQVGFKRNSYGAKTGDVQLAQGEALAAKLERDLVSILRERGYRAVGSSGAGTPADLECECEILSFVVDVKQGF